MLFFYSFANSVLSLIVFFRNLSFLIKRDMYLASLKLFTSQSIFGSLMHNSPIFYQFYTWWKTFFLIINFFLYYYFLIFATGKLFRHQYFIDICIVYNNSTFGKMKLSFLDFNITGFYKFFLHLVFIPPKKLTRFFFIVKKKRVSAKAILITQAKDKLHYSPHCNSYTNYQRMS